MDQTKTDDDEAPVRSPRIFTGGEVIVEIIGLIELKDGRAFSGAIITFPGLPPDIPLSVVWDRKVCLLTIKVQGDSTDSATSKASA